jgi:hypothetical protein
MQNRLDLRTIAATVQDYFSGMYYRDISRLRQAFHPQAFLFGHLQGSFVRISLDQWLRIVEAESVPAENGEPFDMRILTTDTTGRAGFVKVVDLYQGLRFTDYLSLVKVDDQWMIVNKTFHHDDIKNKIIGG